MELDFGFSSILSFGLAAADALSVELIFGAVFGLLVLVGRVAGFRLDGKAPAARKGRNPASPSFEKRRLGASSSGASLAAERGRPAAAAAATAVGADRLSRRHEVAGIVPVSSIHPSRLRDWIWVVPQVIQLCRTQVQRALALYRAAIQAGLDLKKVPEADCQQLFSALTTSSIRVGQAGDALSLFRDLRQMGLGIFPELFASATKLCTSKQCFTECLSFYDFVIAEEDGAHVINDKSVWSCLLFCAIESRSYHRCISLFENLKAAGTPSHKDYGNMTRYASIHGDCELSLRLIEEMRAGKVDIDSVIYNTVLACCVGADQVDRARKLLGEMEQMAGITDVITYNTLAKGYAKAGRMDQCFELYEVMRSRGIEPSQVTYGILLDGCINENQVDRAMEVFDCMTREGCTMNTVLCTTLIKGFARAGQVDQAMKVYEQMRTERNVAPDVITFSILIKANCDSCRLEEALQLLQAMLGLGLRPDEVVFNNLLGGCMKECNSDLAKRLYQDMVESGIRPSNATFSIMIRLHAQCKQLDEAVNMLRREPAARGVEPEPRIFAQLTQCCLRERQGRRAIEVYKLLLEYSKPTAAVHNGMLSMCVKLNMLDTGAEILSLAAANGARVDARDANRLLEAAARKRKTQCVEACQAAMATLGLAQGSAEAEE